MMMRWAAMTGIAAMSTMPQASSAPPQVQVEEAEDAPEIVVIGRKLRKVRIHYVMRGPWVRSCGTEVSSGDPRIDRIMCAILRACVRSGQHEVAAAKACMAARIDSLGDAAEAAMLTRAGAATAVSPEQAAPGRRDDEIVVTGRSEPDIVVTGGNPTIRGGLWAFRRTATFRHGGGGGTRSARFTQCLPDGAIEAMLRRAAGEGVPAPGAGRCGSMRMAFGGGKLHGSRSCSRIVPDLAGGTTTGTDRLNLTGRYDERRLTLNYNVEEDFDGLERAAGPGWNPKRPVGYRWQVTAIRQGACPLNERRDELNVMEAMAALFDVTGPNDP